MRAFYSFKKNLSPFFKSTPNASPIQNRRWNFIHQLLSSVVIHDRQFTQNKSIFPILKILNIIYLVWMNQSKKTITRNSRFLTTFRQGCHI